MIRQRHDLTLSALAAAAETIPGLACFLLAFCDLCCWKEPNVSVCAPGTRVCGNRIALRNIWRPAKNTNPRGDAPITRQGEMGRRRRRSEADPRGSGLAEIQDEERAQRDARRETRVSSSLRRVLLKLSCGDHSLSVLLYFSGTKSFTAVLSPPGRYDCVVLHCCLFTHTHTRARAWVGLLLPDTELRGREIYQHEEEGDWLFKVIGPNLYFIVNCCTASELHP